MYFSPLCLWGVLVISLFLVAIESTFVADQF